MKKTKLKKSLIGSLLPLIIIVIGILLSLILIKSRMIFFNRAQVVMDSSDSGYSQPGSSNSSDSIVTGAPNEPYPTIDPFWDNAKPIPMPEVTGILPPAPTEPPYIPPSGIACALDAKICPDGTAVGRVPPNCEFAPCPGESNNIDTPILPDHPYPTITPAKPSLTSAIASFIDQIKRFFFR